MHVPKRHVPTSISNQALLPRSEGFVGGLHKPTLVNGFGSRSLRCSVPMLFRCIDLFARMSTVTPRRVVGGVQHVPEKLVHGYDVRGHEHVVSAGGLGSNPCDADCEETLSLVVQLNSCHFDHLS